MVTENQQALAFVPWGSCKTLRVRRGRWQVRQALDYAMGQSGSDPPVL